MGKSIGLASASGHLVRKDLAYEARAETGGDWQGMASKREKRYEEKRDTPADV